MRDYNATVELTLLCVIPAVFFIALKLAPPEMDSWSVQQALSDTLFSTSEINDLFDVAESGDVWLFPLDDEIVGPFTEAELLPATCPTGGPENRDGDGPWRSSNSSDSLLYTTVESERQPTCPPGSQPLLTLNDIIPVEMRSLPILPPTESSVERPLLNSVPTMTRYFYVHINEVTVENASIKFRLRGIIHMDGPDECGVNIAENEK
jgi:hypothetical protein